MQRRIAALLAVSSASLLALPVTPARACLNDRDSDSLAVEGRALPDVIQVIVGRFERNPTLFYEMRLKRVVAEIAKTPNNLYLYDDAAVACDRLGRQDEAIVWIEKKRARLEGLAQKDPKAKDHWYRYYANVGTFWAHRWIKAGAPRERISEMEKARDFIAKGLELNPNAHFNREPYQLKTMEWIIANKGETLGRFINPEYEGKAQDAIEGLSGLIVLGNAWESVDVYDALECALVRGRKQKVGYLAMLRVKELFAAGRKSFTPTNFDTKEKIEKTLRNGRYYFPPTNTETIEKKYRDLRADAEKWQQTRLDYMLPRLRRGQHPDTDPAFWNSFHSAPPPSLEASWFQEAPQNFENWLFRRYGIIAVLFYLFIGLALFAIGRGLWRWRSRSVRPSI